MKLDRQGGKSFAPCGEQFACVIGCVPWVVFWAGQVHVLWPRVTATFIAIAFYLHTDAGSHCRYPEVVTYRVICLPSWSPAVTYPYYVPAHVSCVCASPPFSFPVSFTAVAVDKHKRNYNRNFSWEKLIFLLEMSAFNVIFLAGVLYNCRCTCTCGKRENVEHRFPALALQQRNHKFFTVIGRGLRRALLSGSSHKLWNINDQKYEC